MAQVKHGLWFTTEYDGKRYRARYEDRGWSYSTLRVQEQKMLKKRKWLFFGPMIEYTYWDTIIEDARDQMSEVCPIIYRNRFYEAYKTKLIIFRLLTTVKQVHHEHI
jgi:hypothetical protein